jgi:glycosidase
MEAANDAIGTAAEQLADPESLLALYTAILAVRNANMALAYGNSFTAWEDSTAELAGFYREYTYEDLTQRVLVIHNFDDEAVAMPDVAGTVLYLSGSDLSGTITAIPARSTLIIDVTPEAD